VAKRRQLARQACYDCHSDEADDAAEEVSRGTMPPDRYTRLHPNTKLSADEVATLVAALEAMNEGAGGDNDDHGGRGRG
jgi:hypothetical protein